MMNLELLGIAIVLAPLIGAIIAGMFGKIIGTQGAHWVTILGVTISFVLSVLVMIDVVSNHLSPFNTTVYTWGVSGTFRFTIGFLIDHLTALMIVVVTFVSLMVHIYSIGYMAGDPGYQRFFSYMSLFTFTMLMLVMANNFLQLFFGWEGVGLVSYLLIGFWFNKETANFGSLKAFIANRIGDFGFLLGIAAILGYCNSLDYNQVFGQANQIAHTTIQIWPGVNWSLMTVICILLFIGAMGKSAQMPFHVWLPESMEGPTPISALIHAATMVTAGVFMVARMSPLFEYSQTALSFILVIGATTALFTGIIAIVQNDIKRVIAYSTLSQLGYMVAALGASAFSASIFHLVTHAFFKALLFLAAGSVIMAVHHEQDMRKMGGLRRYLPLTYITFLIGSLALSAIPPFAGFYSKDAIIDSVQLSTIPGATYGYICLLLGTFVTALYIFRAFFYTFHTQERFDPKLRDKIRESSWVVTGPLVLLAIPSVLSGFMLAGTMLFKHPTFLSDAIFMLPKHDVLDKFVREFQNTGVMTMHIFNNPSVWFALAGIVVAWIAYIGLPSLPGLMATRLRWLYLILIRKYGFDDFNQIVLVHGTQKVANTLYKVTDEKIIDEAMVNGSGRAISWLSSTVRKLQTGYLYHYGLTMMLGLVIFIWWLLI